MGGTRGFTAGQRAYLQSLAAVDAVDGRSRIYYADWFRVGCMRRYRAGEKPVDLFREAGLDPKLIGYKRIERAFARWRRVDHTATSDANPQPQLRSHRNPHPAPCPHPAPSQPRPRPTRATVSSRRRLCVSRNLKRNLTNSNGRKAGVGWRDAC